MIYVFRFHIKIKHCPDKISKQQFVHTGDHICQVPVDICLNIWTVKHIPVLVSSASMPGHPAVPDSFIHFSRWALWNPWAAGEIWAGKNIGIIPAAPGLFPSWAACSWWSSLFWAFSFISGIPGLTICSPSRRCKPDDVARVWETHFRALCRVFIRT